MERAMITRFSLLSELVKNLNGKEYTGRRINGILVQNEYAFDT
jgi:hypothetical protein